MKTGAEDRLTPNSTPERARRVSAVEGLLGISLAALSACFLVSPWAGVGVAGLLLYVSAAWGRA